MSQEGLAFCGSDFANSFCICKLLQVIFSSVILIVILHDLIVRYRIEKQINFFFILCTLIILALISNIIYSFDHQIYFFNDLEGYFDSTYFTIIVYHVSTRLLINKKQLPNQRIIKWFINGLFIIYNLLLAAILIDAIVAPYNRCEQLWYIIVDGIGVILSIVLVVIGIMHTRRQKKKVEGLQNPQHYKNPIFNIWVWICINIFSEVCGFTESMIFLVNPGLDCQFNPNPNIDAVIKFIFALLIFHLGFISTVVFFRKKYSVSPKKLQEISEERSRKHSANIQLIEQFDSNPDNS